MNWFNDFGAFLPDLLVALIILVVGWLIAFIVSKLVEGILHRTDLDNRIARGLKGGQPDRLPVERWIALAVFWIIMLFVIVAFLTRLELGAISTPLNNMLDQFLAFLPNLIGALVLIVIAWLIATVLRLVITRVVGASGLARRITTNADLPTDERASANIGQTIGNVVYWLVFLLFLPAILDALNLQGILAPVQTMVDDILGILPNILGAALILVAGWLVARIVRQIVTNLLAGMGIDRIGRSTAATTTGTADTGVRLSNVIGLIVFILILVPVIIAALNVLDIPAIADPAANMLTNFLNALPNIFAAFLLLAIAYFIARIIGQFTANLLASIGFNRWFSWLSLPETASFRRPAPGVTVSTTEPRREPAGGEMVTTRTSPADIVGYIVMVAILLFAAMEAANLLGFDALATLISAFIVQAVNILFGLVIFAFGLFLANQAFRLVRDMNTPNADVLATAARYAIIFFAAALALREMGIAASIVNLAFGLLLGAVAVALAIAFGLGGRDFAARTLENWRQDGVPIPMTGEDPKGPFSGGSPSPGANPPRPSGGTGSEPPIPHTGGSMTEDEIESQYEEPTPFDRSGDEDDLPGTDRFPGEDPRQI